MTHTCEYIEINEGDYGTRKVCISCCEEELRKRKLQQEYDFYGTEPLWDTETEEE